MTKALKLFREGSHCGDGAAMRNGRIRPRDSHQSFSVDATRKISLKAFVLFKGPTKISETFIRHVIMACNQVLDDSVGTPRGVLCLMIEGFRKSCEKPSDDSLDNLLAEIFAEALFNALR